MTRTEIEIVLARWRRDYCATDWPADAYRVELANYYERVLIAEDVAQAIREWAARPGEGAGEGARAARAQVAAIIARSDRGEACAAEPHADCRAQIVEWGDRAARAEERALAAEELARQWESRCHGSETEAAILREHLSPRRRDEAQIGGAIRDLPPAEDTRGADVVAALGAGILGLPGDWYK